VAVITGDAGPTEDALASVLGLAVDHRDREVDDLGVTASWFPVGNEFLEVVVAAERDTVPDRFLGRRGEGGFAMMLECVDLPSVRRRARSARVRVVAEAEDLPRGRRMQFHPKDTGGTFLELHEQFGAGIGDDDGPWPYAGDAWRAARRTHAVRGIVGAEIQSEQPDEVAGIWSHLLDVPLTASPGGGAVLPLRGGHLRFTRALDGRGPGLAGIDVRVVDRDAVVGPARAQGCARDDSLLEIGGLRIYLVD
jgi:hypothetical protein